MRPFNGGGNSQAVAGRTNGEYPREGGVGFKSVPDSIADEFLHSPLHSSCPQSLVNAAPDKEFNSRFRNGQFKSLRTEAGKFFRYGKLPDFALCIRGKRFEDDFFVKPSNQFGTKKAMEFRQNCPFERGEWQAGRAQKLLRADIAGANDVKPGEVVGSVIGQRDASCIEHLQKEIPYQPMGFFDFIE